MGPVAKGLEQGFKSHEIAARVARRGDRRVVGRMLAEIASSSRTVSNAAVKSLSCLAERKPSWLVGEVDLFIALLQSEHRILRWAAMDLVGAVARVDGEERINPMVIDQLAKGLNDASMVTAAHAVENLIRVAEAKPPFRSAIVARLLKLQRSRRDRNCRDILVGKTALGMGKLWPHLQEDDRKRVRSFLERVAAGEGRAAVRALAVVDALQRKEWQ